MLSVVIPSLIYANSSPQFTDLAIPYVCLGDTTSIINNAVDPDGDKLIYSFAHPYRGRGNSPNGNFTYPPLVNYLDINHTPTQPFGPGSYAFINPSTGFTTYFAPTAGQYVVAIDIKEYRNINGVDVLISSTRRELQFIVENCPNVPTPPPIGNCTTPVLQDIYDINPGDL